MSVGLDLLSSIITSGDVTPYLKLKLKQEYFRPSEKELYTLIDEFVMKYGAIPTLEVITGLVGDGVLSTVTAPMEYYKDQVIDRHITDNIKNIVTDTKKVLVEQSPLDALAFISDKVINLHTQTHDTQMVDFRTSAEMIKKHYHGLLTSDQDHGIMMGWDSLDSMTNGLVGGDMVSYIGRPAMGKYQPLDSMVKTYTGWVRMGDIKPGDYLASVDGQPSYVAEIFPQGIQRVYKLTFQDGRTTEAGLEHLWEVMYRDWDSPRVVTTEKLIEMLSKIRYKNRISIRLHSGDFGETEELPLDPWLLGFLLGDGCFRGNYPMISTTDSSVLLRVKELLPKGYRLFHKGRYDYAIVQDTDVNKPNWLSTVLRNFGLWGLTSDAKFIPSEYLVASKSVRLELMRGLMDSDGWVEKHGTLRFATSSKDLSTHFVELARSLGAIATTTIKKTTGLDCYVTNLRHVSPKSLVGLDRKRINAPEYNTHSGTICELRLVLSSIDYIGEKECQCISVSHPSHLYITDNYIVTHNTFQLLYSGHYAWWKQKKRVLIVSMEMDPGLLVQRLAAMHTHYNLTKLKTGNMSTGGFAKVFNSLQELTAFDEPMWIVHGNLTSTIEDIWRLCRQLKPDEVLIDGAYLVRVNDKKMNKWDRIGFVAEAIKASISTDLHIPSIASYQFSRDAQKLKKNEKPGLEHIYGSDVIGQVSSIVLGLFEEDTVETIQKREVQVLKGRGGEVGKFSIKWDFQKMDFGEWKEPTLDELKFI